MSPSPVSSTPILRTTLLWSAAVTALLAIAGAIIGYAAAGAPGLWSALSGVVLAALFLGITGASILIANRWYGDPLYIQLFFGIVMGGWILKLIIFIVALLVLRGQPWIEPAIFFIAIVVSVLAALIIDVVVMLRLRIPHVSDVSLPTADPDGPAAHLEEPTASPEDGPAESGGSKV